MTREVAGDFGFVSVASLLAALVLTALMARILWSGSNDLAAAITPERE